MLRICHLHADQAPGTGICPPVPGLHIVDLPRLFALVTWSLHQQTAKAWKRQVSCGCPSERCVYQSSTPHRIAAYWFLFICGGRRAGAMGTVVTERQNSTGRTARERGMGVCAGRGRHETQRLPCGWHLCSARISAQGKRNQGGWGLFLPRCFFHGWRQRTCRAAQPAWLMRLGGSDTTLCHMSIMGSIDAPKH